MRKLSISLAIIVLATLLHAGAGLALRCGDQLVCLGDAKLEVVAKCGEPTQQTQHDEARVETDGDTKRRVTTSIDEWTYNRGPNDFLYFLRFENGRLADVRTGGYGSTKDPTEDSCRHGELLSVGDSLAESLLKCGEPSLKEQREDKLIEANRRVSVVIEDWTYNFGPDHFLYFVSFENGRIKQISTGSYGY